MSIEVDECSLVPRGGSGVCDPHLWAAITQAKWLRKTPWHAMELSLFFQSELLTLGTDNFPDAKVTMVLLNTSQLPIDMI
jgi:hypothetical protein